ncbi:MAG: hypothetical protein IPM48_14980 [Saprospiraceae bacterium]|nr:hypothetical protein [Saprospiraceae bacterium]
MAQPTIPDHLMKELDTSPPTEKIVQHMIESSRAVRRSTISFTDSIAFLTISFWYFFFTGLALLLGRKLPRKWLDLSHKLDAGRISKKIEDKEQNHIAEASKKVGGYKIVDMETKRPVGLKIEPMKPVKS